MKYFLIGIFLFLTNNIVLADTQLWLSKGIQDNSNNTKTNLTNFKVFHDLSETITVDGMVNNGRNTTTNSNFSQYEFALSKKFPIKNVVIPYIKGAAGVIETSGMASRTYAGAEVGFVAPFGKSDFFTKIDTGVYAGLNNNTLDTKLTKAGLGYNITSKDIIMIRQDWMRGDIKFNALWLQYGRRF